ncbi:MAG: acetate--CoA ligase family protein, partial [Desulfobacterales bacterium]
MDSGGIIQQALDAGRRTLDEQSAHQILSAYGVPMVAQQFYSDPDGAVTAAQAMKFPVVLKGVGPKLQHKTEHGMVRLNLGSPEEVRRAAQELLTRDKSRVEGLLLQPQIEGQREFSAGVVRDSQFGPMVMFGLGGIFTEVMEDTTFGAAPLPPGYARQMLRRVRARKLLGAFRGSRPVNQDQLVQILEALSRLALEIPEIQEVDLNPLIADLSGQIWAVDVLITLSAAPDQPNQGMPPATIPPQRIGELFYPRSIAFVGASATLGKWGHMLVTNTLNGGYEGRIALVNPKGGTIMGNPVYHSLAEIPHEVDLAVVTLPARRVPDLVKELKEKEIRNMVLISSGFGETDAAGKALEQDLAATARQAGILLLGPNTMGIANPHIKLNCIGSPVFPLAGSTAVVAQSGNMGTQLLAFAEAQGIGIRAFIGSGNEAMLTIEDYLEAFGVDEKTRTVMMYLESVKNGPRFLEAAARVGRSKPIVMLTGGRSKAGNRAAASHTGALA